MHCALVTSSFGMWRLEGGDFRQVLPVVEKEKEKCTHSNKVHTCITRFVLWPLFRMLHLAVTMPVSTEKACHKQWLLELDNEVIPTDCIYDVDVSTNLIYSGNVADEVLDDAFSGRSFDLSYAVVLTSRNAPKISDSALGRSGGVTRTFVSEDEAVVDYPSDRAS